MRRTGPRRWVWLLVGFLVLSLVLPVLAADPSLEKQLEQKRKELDLLRRKIEEQKRMLDRATRNERSVLQELARIQQDLEKTEGELKYLEGQLRYTENQVAVTTSELQEAEKELSYRNSLMRKRVRAMYENGAVSYLEVLLSASDFGDFLSRFEALSTILAQDVALYESVKEIRSQVAERKARLESQREHLATLKDAKQQKKAAYESNKAAKKRKLNEIQMDKEAYARALEEYEEQSRKIEQFIRDIASRLNLPGKGSVNFIWPIKGRITSPFGNRFHPILKAWRLHTGIDVGAPLGADVRAMEDGVVIYSGWMGGYGQVVIIDHGRLPDGRAISTLYAHNSRLLVTEGERVVQGQLVAKVGSTGFSTGPHAHFEVRVNGTPVNPLPWLP